MNDHMVVECANEDEASDIGFQMSIDVMESYNCIINGLEEETSEEYEPGTPEWYDYLEGLKLENTCYIVYPIVDTKGKTEKELEKEFCNDKEEFVKTYCQV